MNNEISKTRVNKAGDNFKYDRATDEDRQIFDEWRDAHRFVLNTFQAMLRTKVRGKNIVFAQRHKRKKTIIDKLIRIEGMQLSRMDDIAGCRLIFSDIESLYQFRNDFHKSRFDHVLRNEADKYDYIKKPKQTGYRGIHDIYNYNARSDRGKKLAGLQIEIQYRTQLQHSWATTSEIIGFITESQPKFERGDDRYQSAMQYASEIFARVYENSTGPLPSMSNTNLLNNFNEVNDELGLLKKLKQLKAYQPAFTDVPAGKKNIILRRNGNVLELSSYRDGGDAIKALFRFERKQPDYDIVLVKLPQGTDVRTAFKNYFADARDFIELIENGIETLAKSTSFQ